MIKNYWLKVVDDVSEEAWRDSSWHLRSNSCESIGESLSGGNTDPSNQGLGLISNETCAGWVEWDWAVSSNCKVICAGSSWFASNCLEASIFVDRTSIYANPFINAINWIVQVSEGEVLCNCSTRSANVSVVWCSSEDGVWISIDETQNAAVDHACNVDQKE